MKSWQRTNEKIFEYQVDACKKFHEQMKEVETDMSDVTEETILVDSFTMQLLTGTNYCW